MLLSAGRTALTLTVITGALGAGIAGYNALEARASALPTPEAAPATLVAPQVLRLVDHVTLKRRFTGQFEPAQEVALAFEDGGTLAEVLVREGDAVKAGDVIARLDLRQLQAERDSLNASRDAINAQLELARRTNERQIALLANGHVSQQRVDETSLRLSELSARLAEIDASLVRLDVRLSKTEIRAPFAGWIGSRTLDSGAIAGPGAPVVTLIEDAPARFRVALDPTLATRLVEGAAFDIEVDGALRTAQLSEIAPDLDPDTRSRVAFFDLLDAGSAPPARATGEVILPDDRFESGAWVPLSVDVTEDPVVALEAAEILHLDQDETGGRAFVRGTFSDGALYLPGGTHRVVPGERVRLPGAPVAEAS
jgi:RND family efflux transporter MFP subunit